MKIVLFQINCEGKGYTAEHLRLFRRYLDLSVQNGIADKIVVCSAYHSANFILKEIFNGDHCRVFLGNPDFLVTRISLCLEALRPELVLRLSDGMPMVDTAVFKEMEEQVLRQGKDFCCLTGKTKGVDMLVFSFNAYEKLKGVIPLNAEGKNLKSLFLEYRGHFHYKEFKLPARIAVDIFFNIPIKSEVGFKILSLAVEQAKFDFRDIVECYLRRFGEIRRPTVIGVELTNHCNLACVMCVRDIMTRPLGLMKKELFEKLIRDLQEMGGMEDSILSLAQFGESLIHPDFIEMVEYAVSKGFWNLELSTNGLLIDEKMAARLIHSGLKLLHISLDGNTAKTYEAIRVKGKFDMLVNNIETLIRLKREMKSDMIIRLQIIHSKDTAAEIDDFIKRWRYKVDGIAIKPVHTWAGQLGDDFSQDGECVLDHFCEAFWTNLSVHWDGTVTACCVDINQKYRLGHLQDQGMKEIWNSQILADYRVAFLKKDWRKLPLCEKCSCRWGRVEFHDLVGIN